MKISELTKFAITLGLLPWIPAFILYKHGNLIFALSLIAVFLVLSFICFISKGFAKKFKSILDCIGQFIGRYLAVVVLTIVYFIAVVPTGFLMKIVKRDRLRLKKIEVSTYWRKYENNNSDYENQF